MSLLDIKKLCSFTSDSLYTVQNLSMLSLYVNKKDYNRREGLRN